jgi:hypothetical protein
MFKCWRAFIIFFDMPTVVKVKNTLNLSSGVAFEDAINTKRIDVCFVHNVGEEFENAESDVVG